MENKQFDPCIFCKHIINYFKNNTNYDSSLYEDIYQECVVKTLELLKKDVYVNKRFLALNLKKYLINNIMYSKNIDNVLEDLNSKSNENLSISYTHLENFTLLDFIIISTYKRLRKKSISKVSQILGIPKDIIKNTIKFYKEVINV